MTFVAFAISSLIGYLIGNFLLAGAAAAYASILISYHLYLAFLVVAANREKGISMPVGMTILTHSAFLALLIGLAYSRTHIPLFGLIRLLVPGLAPFESQWLFGGKTKTAPTVAAQPAHMPEATMDDQEAFRVYLTQPDRRFRKPGISLAQEFTLWQTGRIKK